MKNIKATSVNAIFMVQTSLMLVHTKISSVRDLFCPQQYLLVEGPFFCPICAWGVYGKGQSLSLLVLADPWLCVCLWCRELTKAFITFPKPVIAGVGGSAVGLGVALLCLCDVVYSSDKAAFHLPYARLSQTPEGCSSFTLPMALGLASVGGCPQQGLPACVLVNLVG